MRSDGVTFREASSGAGSRSFVCESDADTAGRVRWTRLRADITRVVRGQCPWWLRDHADDFAQTALVKVMAAQRAAKGE